MPEKMEDPPLVDLKVSNPVTYLKKWWKKVVSNEGVDVKLKIHPLTSIIMTLILVGASFGLGRVTLPITHPLVQYIPLLAPTPTPQLWKATAYSGSLRYSDFNNTYYLQTNQDEAITLEVPSNINLTKYIGRRIFATGKQNIQTRVLVVTSAEDLELLPTTIQTLPTLKPSPTPTQSPVLY